MLEDKSKCLFVDVVEEMIEEPRPAIVKQDPLGTCLSHRDLGLFNLGSAIGELDSTLDSISHLESFS